MNDKIRLDIRPFNPIVSRPRNELKTPPPDWTEEDQKALDDFLVVRKALKKNEAQDKNLSAFNQYSK